MAMQGRAARRAVSVQKPRLLSSKDGGKLRRVLLRLYSTGVTKILRASNVLPFASDLTGSLLRYRLWSEVKYICDTTTAFP